MIDYKCGEVCDNDIFILEHVFLVKAINIRPCRRAYTFKDASYNKLRHKTGETHLEGERGKVEKNNESSFPIFALRSIFLATTLDKWALSKLRADKFCPPPLHLSLSLSLSCFLAKVCVSFLHHLMEKYRERERMKISIPYSFNVYLSQEWNFNRTNEEEEEEQDEEDEEGIYSWRSIVLVQRWPCEALASRCSQSFFSGLKKKCIEIYGLNSL